VILRRLLLISLVLIPLVILLTGCATPDMLCAIRPEVQTQPIATHGAAFVTWDFSSELPRRPKFADTYCADLGGVRSCHTRFNFPPPDVNDTCALARIGAEAFHQYGGQHR